ncbi:hypothetical protein B7494_g3324 [Chlorociboria aeruginascens]|nr:hypothetical protein B7494_g3324 [Chlorociboria aeruginascens]
MVSKAKRVAVIGTGPAGAIAVDSLVQENAFDIIRVFERKDMTGGTWVYTPELPAGIPSLRDLVQRTADGTVQIPQELPTWTLKNERINNHQYRFSDTPMQEGLHSNIAPSVMAFTQELIPGTLSDWSLSQYGPNSIFRHREIIREWVENIFINSGNDKLIEFKTTVELAEKRGEEWVLTLRKEFPGKTKDYWWQETFDAVVVASGHFSLPYVPNIPGLLEYNDRFPGRILHSKHYRAAKAFKGKKVVVVGGSVSAFDTLHEVRTEAKTPVYASLRKPLSSFGWTPFEHPSISIKKEITQFGLDGAIYFGDGTTLTDIDHVIFATGYDFSFPFLPKVKVLHRRIPGLYLHVFKQDDPTLAFIGAVTGGFTFRVYEWQAVAVARLLAGRASLPPLEEQQKWEAARLAKRGEGIPFYYLGPEFEEYFETLRAIAGDPGAGSKGRVLPKFDPKWLEAFLATIEGRIAWWKKQALLAAKNKIELAEGSKFRAKL